MCPDLAGALECVLLIGSIMNCNSPISVLLRFFIGCVLVGTLSFTPFPAFPQDYVPRIRFVRDPDPAPPFQLEDIEGKELKLEAFHGKVVLLNFWATWCGPCREEIPALIELQRRYKDHLQVIGLAVDEDDEAYVRKFAASSGMNYPIAMSSTDVRIAYGGVGALPTVFVINPEGRLVQKHVGLFDPVLYETEVRALLQLPIAAKIETFQDQGEIFLKNAERATSLPGVDFSKLSSEQRAVALHKFNAESCPCGCKLTLAQCRIYDHACQISHERTATIVDEILNAKNTKSEPASPDSASPNSPKP